MDSDRLSPHLDDSALLHLVDEDAHPLKIGLWREHVHACGECRSRLDRRRVESDRVRAALAELQVPAGFPPASAVIERARAAQVGVTPIHTRRRRGPWPRAAAAIVILLLPLVLVPSVRAALVDWIRQGWESVVGPSSPPPTEALPPTEAGSGFTLRFTPVGSVLRLTIERAQSEGEIVVARGDGADGSLVVEGEGVEALVTEDGVRVRNDASSRATLRLTVPAALQELTVQIEDRPIQTVTAAELNAGWSTSLR
jgi:hypothetical protein